MSTEESVPGPAPSVEIIDASPAFDWPVWLVSMLLVGTGWLYGWLSAPEPREAAALGGSVTLTVAAGFGVVEGDDLWLASRHDFADHPTRLWIRPLRGATEDGADLDDLVARADAAAAQTGASYRVLRREEREAFGGARTSWSWYAIVRDPPGAVAGDPVLPSILLGVNVVALTADGSAWQISAEGLPGEVEPEGSAVRDMLASVRIHPGAGRRDPQEQAVPEVAGLPEVPEVPAGPVARVDEPVGAEHSIREPSPDRHGQRGQDGARAAAAPRGTDAPAEPEPLAEPLPAEADAGVEPTSDSEPDDAPTEVPTETAAERPVARPAQQARSGSANVGAPTSASPNPYLVVAPVASSGTSRRTVTAEGVATDALTGAPVAARIFVGRPGVDLRSTVYGYLDGDVSSRALSAQLVGTARTNREGEYDVGGLTRGRTHPAAAVAPGYPPVFFSISPSAGAPAIIRVRPIYLRR